MFRYAATLAYAFSAVALGASIDISKINGSIVVEAGQQVQVRDGASAVNGELTLRKGARVGGKLDNVNGTLSFKRPVDVYVGAGVTLPPVVGVQPQRFTL